MDKNSIMPVIFGSTLHRINSRLTEFNQVAYAFCIAEKDGNQDSNPENKKDAHGRILRGFFFVCEKMVHCATMVDRVGECLVSALHSPPSFLGGSSNPARSVTFRFEPKVTVSKFKKETANV